jgi:hypothetical protein
LGHGCEYGTEIEPRAPLLREHVAQGELVAVLIEAGYRCGNLACRTILAIDLHDMVEVTEGGRNEPGNEVVT